MLYGNDCTCMRMYLFKRLHFFLSIQHGQVFCVILPINRPSNSSASIFDGISIFANPHQNRHFHILQETLRQSAYSAFGVSSHLCSPAHSLGCSNLRRCCERIDALLYQFPCVGFAPVVCVHASWAVFGDANYFTMAKKCGQEGRTHVFGHLVFYLSFLSITAIFRQ